MVHGVHTALWLLEEALGQIAPQGLRRVSARFLKPCRVGETIRGRVVLGGPGQAMAQALLDGEVVAELSIHIGNRRALSAPAQPAAAPLQQAALPNPGQFQNCHGKIAIGAVSPELSNRFPRCTDAIGAGGIGCLAAMSQLVGMHCPGRFSLFSGFDIEFSEVGQAVLDWLNYKVVSVDERFHFLTIDVHAAEAVRGSIRAFWRPGAVKQKSSTEIFATMKGKPYRGHSALVIGGSRGIGEVTAKLIAAGGGHVTITYLSRKAEAEALAQEIRGAGGVCNVLRFDANEAPLPQLKLATAPTAFFYFATPRIAVRRTKVFSSDLVREFERQYVAAFFALCEAMGKIGRAPVKGFYPSSTALDEHVPDMLEYSIAKAAGEELCRHIERLIPEIKLTVCRLPRIETDQTFSFFPAEQNDPVAVMGPIVDKMLR